MQPFRGNVFVMATGNGNGTNGDSRYNGSSSAAGQIIGILASILILVAGLCGYLIVQEHGDEITITKLTSTNDVFGDHLHALDTRVDDIDRNGNRGFPDLERQLAEVNRRLDSDEQTLSQCRAALQRYIGK